MDSLNQFDPVVCYYDRLAGLVFGKSLLSAQTEFLDKIPPSSHVLAVGGGSGLWLKQFLRMRPDCRIIYVEPSFKMLKLAVKNVGPDERIRFIHGTVESMGNESGFDAVLTFFVFDIFSDPGLSEFIIRIKALLRGQASWLVSDFVEVKWWHRLLLFIMYLFFRITVNLRTRKLPGWEQCMKENGFVVQQQNSFYGSFIRSVWYQAD